ncbi:MAG: hypothetical protein ACTH6A_19755, partial [Brachybacterium tyrofermentans]|uniref:hypothetical protein n=1 Tax=Brachybacterium tyrofermentans TaxID=47848 RepID=UPI003F8F326A
MDIATTRPAPVRNPRGVASAVAGGLAIALSVCGQLLAARRYATDVKRNCQDLWIGVPLPDRGVA